jgi:cupin 2 domain-containing protein
MKTGKDNFFDTIPAHLSEELNQCLVNTKHLKIEKIVSLGHITPDGQWYDQAWDEWVLVLQGQATLRFQDGDVLHLQAGDFINIPAHCRHRVDWTAPDIHTVWLAIHYECN